VVLGVEFDEEEGSDGDHAKNEIHSGECRIGGTAIVGRRRTRCRRRCWRKLATA
jgi:hypothetical protein